MAYTCSHCGFSFDGLSFPPFCPFCRKTYGDTAEIDDILSQAEMTYTDKNFGITANLLLQAIDLGSTEAAYRYALMAENGVGMKRDKSEAIRRYAFAASRAHAKAAGALGRILLGDRDPGKTDLARFFLSVAAEEGDTEAAFLYGSTFDDEHTLYYLTLSALDGNKKAALLVARRYYLTGDREQYAKAKGFLMLSGAHAITDPRMTAALLTVAAMEPTLPDRDENGVLFRLATAAENRREYFLALTFYGRIVDRYPLAATRIGDMFVAGRGVPKNPAAAGKWYLRAADAGENAAMVSLGEMLLTGNGVEKDEQKALTLFCRCAALGDPKAEFLCAEMYFEGTAVKRDLPLALTLYDKAADKHYTPAVEKRERICATVTDIYNSALKSFREKDYDAAFRGFSIAAELRHGGAIANLACCYRDGYGCKKNLRRAVELYRRAIVYGKASARYNLGLCYMNNLGVRFDPKHAEELLRGSGHPDAEAIISAMKKRKTAKTARRLYAAAVVMFRKGQTDDSLRACMAAAHLGDKAALCRIGLHYEFGVGVLNDIEKARGFYRQSGLSLGEINRLKRGFLRSRLEAIKNPKR